LAHHNDLLHPPIDGRAFGRVKRLPPLIKQAIHLSILHALPVACRRVRHTRYLATLYRGERLRSESSALLKPKSARVHLVYHSAKRRRHTDDHRPLRDSGCRRRGRPTGGGLGGSASLRLGGRIGGDHQRPGVSPSQQVARRPNKFKERRPTLVAALASKGSPDLSHIPTEQTGRRYQAVLKRSTRTQRSPHVPCKGCEREGHIVLYAAGKKRGCEREK
jgi:hypothetical protein